MGELSLRRMGGGAKVATGTFSTAQSTLVSNGPAITGLGFKPKKIIVFPTTAKSAHYSNNGYNVVGAMLFLDSTGSTINTYIGGAYYVVANNNSATYPQIVPNDDGFTFAAPSSWMFYPGDFNSPGGSDWVWIATDKE